ncbi:proteasome assembly chaperone 1-like [Argonauta hians]
MATFFGEVLPVYSRATGDDYYDEEEEEQGESITWTTNIKWTEAGQAKHKNNKLPCSLLVIAIGQVSTGFCQAHLLGDTNQALGWLSTTTTTTSDTTTTDDDDLLSYRNAQVYMCGSDVVLVQCTKQILPEQSFGWVHKLFDSVQVTSSEVLVLSSAPRTDFRTEASLSLFNEPFLRTLTSSCFASSKKPLCPYLEQPNLIPSLSAQVLTYCEIYKIAAQLFVCYSDLLHVDSIAINKFSPLLNHHNIKPIAQNEKVASEAIKKFVDLSTPSSSLYL